MIAGGLNHSLVKRNIDSIHLSLRRGSVATDGPVPALAVFGDVHGAPVGRQQLEMFEGDSGADGDEPG